MASIRIGHLKESRFRQAPRGNSQQCKSEEPEGVVRLEERYHLECAYHNAFGLLLQDSRGEMMYRLLSSKYGTNESEIWEFQGKLMIELK